MRLRRSVTTTFLMLVLGVFLAPAASAQAPYPPTTGNGQVSRGTVPPGGCVTFTGDGFTPAASVTVSDNGTTVTTTTATLTGTFSASVCPQVLGVHLLRGTDGTRTVTAEVVVQALAATGASGVLPSIAVGLALVLTGSGIVYYARRRRVVRFS